MTTSQQIVPPQRKEEVLIEYTLRYQPVADFFTVAAGSVLVVTAYLWFAGYTIGHLAHWLLGGAMFALVVGLVVRQFERPREAKSLERIHLSLFRNRQLKL